MRGHGDDVGVERDRSLGELAELRAQESEDVAVGLDDLEAAERFRRLDVAAVRRQHEAVAADQDRGVRAREAREVADVDRIRDEERGCAQGVELAAQELDPGVHACSFRYVSASR